MTSPSDRRSVGGLRHARSRSPAHRRAELLLAFLHQQRAALRNAAFGLTDDEAVAAPSASALSVAGLIKHAAAVERSWMGHVLQRRSERTPDDYASNFVLVATSCSPPCSTTTRCGSGDRADHRRHRRPRAGGARSPGRPVVPRRRGGVVGALGIAAHDRGDGAPRGPRRHRARVDRRRDVLSVDGRGGGLARNRVDPAVAADGEVDRVRAKAGCFCGCLFAGDEIWLAARLTREDGTVDRAVRFRRRLGPGPVHAAERLPEQRSVLGEDARRQVCHRTAAFHFSFHHAVSTKSTGDAARSPNRPLSASIT